MENSDTLGVLKQLERGEISASEADNRLSAPPPVERVETPPFDRTQMPAWISQIGFWTISVGVLVVILGAWIIAATVRTNPFWFFIGLPLVLLGALAIAFGSSAFGGHWIYINVENKRKRRNTVRFGIPFPLGLLKLALWLASIFADQPLTKLSVEHPNLKFNFSFKDTNELFTTIERELRAGRGFSVDVDEKDEHVHVYIV